MKTTVNDCDLAGGFDDALVIGDDRSQSILFPECLDDYLAEDNPVRAIDVFVDELDLAGLGFGCVEPEASERLAYHPATLLKIYAYEYLNRCSRGVAWSESVSATSSWFDRKCMLGRPPLESAQTHCYSYRAVTIEPVSANRLLKNGNFCGSGWRLSAYSR